MPHVCARAAAAIGWAGSGRGRAMARRCKAGKQAGGERAGVAMFCHLIHIITGVTLFDGGGELIASVTVFFAFASLSPGILRCLSPFPSQPYIRSPLSVQISVCLPQPLPRETTSQQPSGFPVPYLCAHRVAGE